MHMLINMRHYIMSLVVLYNSSFCIPLFIYLPRYFEIPGATLKSVTRLSGLLGELPGTRITTYSRVLRNTSDWSKRLLNMDEYFKAYTSHFWPSGQYDVQYVIILWQSKLNHQCVR